MKKKMKRETFIFEGLGFPIRLINVPMKEVFGEWTIDINFNILQLVVLETLAKKHGHLTGSELRFIMDYLGMSTRKFANLFDVTHVAVQKWLKEDVKMNPNTEICLKLYLLDFLKVTDKDFRKLYLEIRQKSQIEDDNNPLEVDAKKIAC